MSLKLIILWVVTVVFLFGTGSESICSKHCIEPVGPNKPSVPTGNSWYFDNNSKECSWIKGQYFEKGGNRFMNKEICEITCMGCKSTYNLRQAARAGNCPPVTTTHDRDFSEDNCASDDDCEDSAQKCCPDGGRFKSCLNAVVSLNRIQSNMIYKEPAQPRAHARWNQDDQHEDWRNEYAFAYANNDKIMKGTNDGRLNQFFTENGFDEGSDHESEEAHINSFEEIDSPHWF